MDSGKFRFAPVVLFAYARPEHTRRALAALASNKLAGQSDLIVYADAARTEQEVESVNAVRAVVRNIKGFRSVTLFERVENFGLANNIIQGVSEICKRYGRVIVVEDDLVTSPHFLSYMNEALARYADDNRVVSVHAYVYPVAERLPETFFLRGADCWGWATWMRGWSIFNPDGRYLLDEIRRQGLEREFNFNNAYPYSDMLEAQVEGVNDSWAVRWHASAFLAGKLTLYPGRSLVHNIGNDSSGTHCRNSRVYDIAPSSAAICVEPIEVVASATAYRAFEKFFRGTRGGRAGRLWNRVLRFMRGWPSDAA